jgi:hypothetical protein
VTRGLLVACALVALAGVAAAQTRIQVLQSEGRADAKVRARIDAGIRALARRSGEQVIPGDITFTEAAAAVGCRPEDAACKDEVLGMLAVDEIVVTAVTPKPGGFEVAVRRLGKGGAAREAISFIAFDRVDKLEPLEPLFAPRPVSPPFIGPRLAPGPEPAPAPGGPPSAAATSSRPPPPELAPDPAPGGRGGPPSATEPLPSPAATSPPLHADTRADRPPGRRRLAMAGMAGGGAMLLVGFVLWGSAASVQSQIDAAPVGTKTQLRELQDLEARGDGYATAGNWFAFGGLVVGGISTYYFVKSGRKRTTSARLVPAVFRGGGGLALAIGGTP